MVDPILDAALEQIDRAFGKLPDRPERRKAEAKRRLEQLVPALDGARKAVEAEKAREHGECPEIAIDPFSAYAVAWFLRQEADSDQSIAQDGVPEALEEAADQIEGGDVFGSAEDMLADLVAEIHHQAYIAEHGEDPPSPMPPEYAPDSRGDGLPF